MQLIGANPSIGRVDDSLPGNYRLYVVGSHVIVYRNDTTSIGIVRILHQRMQIARHMP